MFHMLTCFNLQPKITIEEFSQAIDNLTAHLKTGKLLDSTGPIGRRQRDTIMDTDSERNHEYFVLMSFQDRAQCDRAVEHIRPQGEPGVSIHKAVYSKVLDPIFICWDDL